MKAIVALLLLWLAVEGQFVVAQQCTDTDKTKLPSSDAFVAKFFLCYDDDRTVVNDCFANATHVEPNCASCFQAASTCITANCAAQCLASPKTPTCITCATTACQPNLNTCTGSSSYAFDPCKSFFCSQPAYVLPVIIAGSVLGFILLLVLGYCVCRRSRDEDSSCCSCCEGFSCAKLCCWSRLNDDERIEERLRKQNEERIEKLNRNRENSSASAMRYGQKAEFAKRSVGVEFPAQTDNFEMSAGFGDDADFEKKREDDWQRRATVDKNEHNIRASKLPEGFRIQSVQPGLTPEMIFNMDTVKSMQEANKAAINVPAAVVASHKALKMMGVNESDVQKPFSEPVTARVERIAKAANKQGLMSGGATANLGNQIAEQFAIKRKQAEERAEAYRQAELKKEEARIRAEIARENKEEVSEKRRTLRESKKLSPEDAKRLSLAAAARRSAKSAGETVAAAGNKLKDFLERTEKS